MDVFLHCDSNISIPSCARREIEKGQSLMEIEKGQSPMVE